MNWEHLKAFAWLRWRLLLNQQRAGGVVNAVLLMIVVIVRLVMAIPISIGGFMLGSTPFPRQSPRT